MGYKRKFILFILGLGAVILFISMALYFSTASKNEPAIAISAAFLGATITLASFSYDKVVTNPDLKIIYNSAANYDDIHRPSIRVIVGGTDRDRKHIRVIVKNDGQKVAKSCYACIKILENGKVDGCKAFSYEPKTLMWALSFGDIRTIVDIAPYGAEQYLEVIFADDHDPVSWDVVECKIEQRPSNKAPLRAYASTPAAYTQWQNRNQDGFCQGRFRIGLIIYSETAKPCRKDFELIISDKWDKTSMSQLKKEIK